MPRQARRAREGGAVEVPEGVDVVLEVGRFKDFSRFVDAVFVPDPSGYRRVDAEPLRKKWIDLRRGRAVFDAYYRLPVGSVIVVREVAPGSVRVRAYAVGEGGTLEELPTREERVVVESVGGREVWRYDVVVDAPRGTVRVEGTKLYAIGVGKVTDLEKLREEVKYALIKDIDALRGTEPERPLKLYSFNWVFELGKHYVAFREGRRLTPEEEAELRRLGFRRSPYKRELWILDLTDPGIADADTLTAWLRSNAKDVDEVGFLDRLRRAWEWLRPVRELKRGLTSVLGVAVKEVLHEDSTLKVRLGEFVSRERFDELRSRYPFRDGYFHVSICEEPVRSIVLTAFQDPDSAKYLEEKCGKRRAEEEFLRRVKELFRRRYGVEPTSVELHGDEYYLVRFPLLGREKFKELASRYTYTRGGFAVGKGKLAEEMKSEGLLEGLDLELLRKLKLV